jgi:hypothetical protein
MGWKLDALALAQIDRIVTDCVRDPVGPEFMAPPARLATWICCIKSGGSAREVTVRERNQGSTWIVDNPQSDERFVVNCVGVVGLRCMGAFAISSKTAFRCWFTIGTRSEQH